MHTHLGCPIAWLISNREDEATLTMLFKTVKIHCPNASINTLMTDDGTVYNNNIYYFYNHTQIWLGPMDVKQYTQRLRTCFASGMWIGELLPSL